MGKQQHSEAQSNTKDYLRSKGVSDHMIYGPVSDQYWREPLRVVAINMEPYGYESSGFYPVDRDTLHNWVYDVGGTRTRTTRYTMALMGVVLAQQENGGMPVRSVFQEAYLNHDRIDETIERTAYYNIRPDSNHQKAQDYGAISAVGESELGRLLWKEILALDAHIMLVSGHAGLASVNSLIRPMEPLCFRDACVHPDGFLIYSIAHPSRPNYAEWGKVVERIRKWRSRR